MMRGFAIVASGFIATAQLDESAKVTTGYGAHKWLRVIVYTGVMMLVASLGAVGIFYKVAEKAGEKDGSLEVRGVKGESA